MPINANIPDLSNCDFVYAWTLDGSLETLSANNVAMKLSKDPFSGLIGEDKNKLKAFIADESKADIYLPWITPDMEHSLWLKWQKKKYGDMTQLCAFEVTEVKNNELYLSQILDSISDLILVKGEGSRIVWANKAFQEHYNLNNDQLKELIDAPNVEPDYTKQYIIDDKQVWDTKKPLLIECEPVMRFDGVVRKFETLKTPVLGPHNKVIFTVGVSRDITEKIENEEKSITAAKMAAIGEMSGGMAHEINNPIAVIAGKVYLLKRTLNRKEEVSKEHILNYLDTIEFHVERIASVINTLRRLSVDSDFEDFRSQHLASLIKDTLLLCETKIKEKGINLIIEIPEDLYVEVRAVQFSKAILNLLNNATEAVEDRSEKWIKLSARKDGDALELKVIDSGEGVSDDIAGKIMQPFFTTKDVGKGSGLGLSFALSVAKNHHGSLRLDKEIGPSAFILRVPFKQKQ